MDMDTNFHELISAKIEVGNELVNDLKNFSNVGGIEKLQRKLIQEKNFLEKVGELIWCFLTHPTKNSNFS